MKKLVSYSPKLKEFARKLRNNSTNSEIRLWSFLKGRQMKGYDFHRQKPVDRYILDFFCQELMMGIELDGWSHILDTTYQKDIKKEERMKELGITILRFSDEEVMQDIMNVIRTIEHYICGLENKK
jgi:very-short-patch-repair endonuclease